MSATTTGTPAADSCSVSSCSVFVLPVPVAPAIRPCRLSMPRSTRMRATGYAVPSSTTEPSSRARPRNEYPPAIAVAASAVFDCVRASVCLPPPLLVSATQDSLLDYLGPGQRTAGKLARLGGD